MGKTWLSLSLSLAFFICVLNYLCFLCDLLKMQIGSKCGQNPAKCDMRSYKYIFHEKQSSALFDIGVQAKFSRCTHKVASKAKTAVVHSFSQGTM